MSDLIAIGTLGVGIIGFFLAYASYRQAVDEKKTERMHALFSRYLELDLSASISLIAVKDDIETKNLLKDKLVTIKLYALEEAWDLLQIRRLESPWLSFFKKSNRDFVSDWEQTIRTHLSIDSLNTLKNLVQNQECYLDEFFDFSYEYLFELSSAAVSPLGEK